MNETMNIETLKQAIAMLDANEIPETVRLLFTVRDLRILGYEKADEVRPGDEFQWQGRTILVLPF